MHHHYNDITEIIAIVPTWYDANGVPRFCAHHPQHSADIYASEVALLRISCQGCGHEFHVQMTSGMWEVAMELVRLRGGGRVAQIIDQLLKLAPSGPEIDKLAAEVAELRATKPSTLADSVRDGTIHYGDPPNAGCCMAGPTMNCWDLAVVEFWDHSDVRAGWQRVPELERDLPDMTAAERLERL